MYATQSLTFRGLTIMVLGYLLPWLGYAIDAETITRLVDATSILVFTIGAITAGKGRIRADEPIIGFKPPPS